MIALIGNFQAYRPDKVLRDWRFSPWIVGNAQERTCNRNTLPLDTGQVYDCVIT